MLCSVTTQPLNSYEDESDMAKYVDELAMLEEFRALPFLSLEEALFIVDDDGGDCEVCGPTLILLAVRFAPVTIHELNSDL